VLFRAERGNTKSLSKLLTSNYTKTLALQIDHKAPLVISAQIAEQIKFLIAIKKLEIGEVLPPTTVLAKQLDVNHNTVASVYTSLTDAGYLSAQRGKGTFVADTVCVQNLRKNHQHYHLLRQAFTVAKEIQLSPSEFAGAAYAQAVMSSISQLSPPKLVFVEEQSAYGFEVYRLVQSEINLSVSFVGWTDVVAQKPEAIKKLRSADLVITTAAYAGQTTQLSQLCKEIAIVEVRPSSELLTQASSLPHHAQMLIIGSNHSEAKQLKQLLEASGICHIHLHTTAIEQIQYELEKLEKFDAVCLSSQVEAQSQVMKTISHPNLSEFSFKVDPTHLLVLKARISSIQSKSK
jgi:DNA-binding transcriptional regulator YhcF (GntR family)